MYFFFFIYLFYFLFYFIFSLQWVQYIVPSAPLLVYTISTLQNERKILLHNQIIFIVSSSDAPTFGIANDPNWRSNYVVPF